MPEKINIADRLRESASRYPFQRAIVFPTGRDRAGRVTYTHLTFQQLDRESDLLASGLQQMGVRPGTRLAVLVRPSLEFIALTFALFKAAAVAVLIDPGMGRANLLKCLGEVQPQGFVAIPVVHAIRTICRGRFPDARINVTVGGRRWFWGGRTYDELIDSGLESFRSVDTSATDAAAIIFTSGSTGPPKGVLYEHGMFDAQVKLLRDFYQIQPGEVDLPGFPLFGLFNSAMGVTTVIPDMDPSKPAQVNPGKILEAIEDQGVTQAFGSPAIWNRVGRYCQQHNIQIPSLRRVLSAGAPVPNHVLERMRGALSEEGAEVHTPYGATESLPVTSIAASEVLNRTGPKTRAGSGTCVGRAFPHVSLKIIEITEGPIASIADVHELPAHEIGEIIVASPATTREYHKKPLATIAAKISDEECFWHRMGDVGYLDEQENLWFCGRKAHIVVVQSGRMFTVPCEAIFNEHPRVFRTALVGIGAAPRQRPIVVVEPEVGQFPNSRRDRTNFENELRDLAVANPLTTKIDTFLFHAALPVDIRHNVKIDREKLRPWASRQLAATEVAKEQ